MKLFSGLAFFLLIELISFSQEVKKEATGVIAGNLIDSTSQKAVAGATVELINLQDWRKLSQGTEKNGEFSFSNLGFGFYRLSISSVGYAVLKIDSINVRQERYDFNLADIRLSSKSGELETVVVYVEKPLIQSKDGNIIFNAVESALAA